MPLAAKVGEDQQLSCRYQLGNTEALYFLRWHKDGNEFFRYMPKETPPQRFYNVSGISGIQVKVNFHFLPFFNRSNRAYKSQSLLIQTCRKGRYQSLYHISNYMRSIRGQRVEVWQCPAGGFTYSGFTTSGATTPFPLILMEDPTDRVCLSSDRVAGSIDCPL